MRRLAKETVVLFSNGMQSHSLQFNRDEIASSDFTHAFDFAHAKYDFKSKQTNSRARRKLDDSMGFVKRERRT